MTYYIPVEEIPRDTWKVLCPECGVGTATKVECTQEERDEYGCDRWFDCCSAAYVCDKCNHRFAVRLPAPEANW